jgi:Smg protein
MFEVLVYMFENYVEANIQPDHNTLAQELFEAGFDSSDINGAFDWFSSLESMADEAGNAPSGITQSIRIYSNVETEKIDVDGLSFLMFLMQANVINHALHEVIMDRAMALSQEHVGVDEIRWTALMALRKQGRTEDFLFVEDAVFGDDSPTFH